MIYEPSSIAVVIFLIFVAITLALSFYLGRRARTSAGYYAAGGGVPWFVNGVAFAGDYLSAASFLGICGMIAFAGYDGFLYSIGYLAGWVVALFVVAEPLKRLGKYTFADALDNRFQSRGIKLAAAVSTLAVSVFYLIPQMVGAGVLIQPLLGFPHAVGVLVVGAVVILIVTTAGMVSTTYVQFLKGSLLVVFSLILTCLILNRGLHIGGSERQPELVGPAGVERWLSESCEHSTLLPSDGAWKDKPYLRLRHNDTGEITTWRKIATSDPGPYALHETQTLTVTAHGRRLVNGLPQGHGPGERDMWPVGHAKSGSREYFSELTTYRSMDGVTTYEGEAATGPVGPLGFLGALRSSEIVLWGSDVVRESDGSVTTVFYPKLTPGEEIL